MAVDVALSWSLSPTTASKVDGQRVYRTTTSSPTFPTDYTQIASVGDSATTYTDTGVSLGTYTYAVTAYNSGGESNPTTDTVDATLSAPTNLAVTDDTVEDELTLDWDEVSNASSYNVYRAQSSGSTKSDYTLVAEPTSPPYTDTNLEDGERFYYRVSAHD